MTSEDHVRLAAELDTTARTLIGRRVTRVAYYGLYTDHPTAAAWDFDTWHCPVMGVELLLDDGAAYSAVWDVPFGHFSLHLYAAPMASQLTVYEQGGNGLRWTVQDHARWAPLLAGPVLDSRLIWHPDLTDFGNTAPAGLRLTFPAGSVWIIAAMESTDGSWWVGADEVVVAFTPDMAARTGVRDPGGPHRRTSPGFTGGRAPASPARSTGPPSWHCRPRRRAGRGCRSPPATVA